MEHIKKRGRPPKKSPEQDAPNLSTENLSSALRNGKPEATTNRSIRMSDATHDALHDVKTACGDTSLEETLKQLVNSFHLTEARKAFPERGAEIAQFEGLCRKMIDAYVHSLILFNDADARAKDAVKAELESKDKIIISLQEKVQELEKQIKQLHVQLAEAIEERDAALSEIETLKTANLVDIEVSKHLADFQKQLSEALSTLKK